MLLVVHDSALYLLSLSMAVVEAPAGMVNGNRIGQGHSNASSPFQCLLACGYDVSNLNGNMMMLGSSNAQ